MNDQYYSCVFCFSDNYLNETFECMESLYPDTSIYFICYGNGISFRSRNDNINIGELVRPLGGGGHKGAGGIKIPIDMQLNYLEDILDAVIYENH